ncbi:f-box only protein [Anaeramoeba ignava]|uniref:F-box only protein n=1 Tax=Anaeramoeba ignava TaxID=1746090 RepID=A0A9Q0RDC7_ANAIG|nr:f-box only protein [Anaeramoeba ignava]
MSSLNDNLLDKTSKEIKETQKRILYSEKLRFRFPGDFKSILRQLYPINKLNSISIAIKEKVTVQKQNFEFNEKMYYNGLEIEDFFGDGNVEKQKSEQKESLSEIYQLEEDESYFDWLPEELILMIFEYLDKPHHLCFCEATCQMFFRISNEPLLWRRVLQENAPYIDFIYVHESAYRSLGNTI